MSTSEKVWKRLIGTIINPYGVAGIMGNIYAESGMIANRVEILCLKRLKEHGKVYSDESYTEAVDSGKITMEEFMHPLPNKQYGYGLCQWTSPMRKAGLYYLCRSKNASIGDADVQIDWLLAELQTTYKNVLAGLKSAKSVREASDIFLTQFEMPADTSEAIKKARASYGEKYYNEFIQNVKTSDSPVKNDTAGIIEKAVTFMEQIANDPSHGYDQVYRWNEKGDYDCSSLVVSAWQAAGVPVKDNGATNTWTINDVFPKCGFSDVTNSVDLSTGFNLKRGDVLLNVNKHVAIYCGNGNEVEASINEKGTATGGSPGDQTGREILIRPYRNYPWDKVLRYTGGQTVQTSSEGVLRIGSKGDAVKVMQTMLEKIGYNLGRYGCDGDFGNDTLNALIKFQSDHPDCGAPDGEYGPLTRRVLNSVYSEKINGQFCVKIAIPDLRIRELPSIKAHSPGCIAPGVYTIVDTQEADGYTWGRLKSSAGWIALKYTVRV